MLNFFKKDKFILVLLNILGIYLFCKMTEDVINLELITKIDTWIYEHIPNLYTPFLNNIMIFISSINNIYQLISIVIIILLLLNYYKLYTQMIFFCISIIGNGILFLLIKEIIKRERPLSQLIEISGYSFPSGHATLSTTLALSLYLIFKDKIQYKKLFLGICISFPLLISFTRVYLCVHYLSDIIAGIGLGLIWVSSIYLIFFYNKGLKNETEIFYKK
jgi:undecaprenyl-diphosphatase